MENILYVVTVYSDIAMNKTRVPTLNLYYFPFRVCDISLPQCKTGFVYFLIVIWTMDYTYIGECKCFVTRLYHHNSGHDSTSTMPENRCPFAIMGYICGFYGKNKALHRQFRKAMERKMWLFNLWIKYWLKDLVSSQEWCYWWIGQWRLSKKKKENCDWWNYLKMIKCIFIVPVYSFVLYVVLYLWFSSSTFQINYIVEYKIFSCSRENFRAYHLALAWWYHPVMYLFTFLFCDLFLIIYEC